jgi:tRNA (guanine37-N1)-methyltransferase
MNFDVLTIFPEMVDPFFDNGMIKRGIDLGLIAGSALNIRDFAEGRHRVTDDRPYGGGCGMVMKPEPLAGAIRAAREKYPPGGRVKTLLMSPQGRPFTQALARELSTLDGLVLVCGRYEGADERICHDLIDEEISIGDYVMTGGELAAMVVIDAVARLVPGVLGGEESADKDSFEGNLIEHAHYTRPFSFEGKEVPGVLLSGNHAEIDKWRFKSSVVRTFLKRPDLLADRPLEKGEKEVLKEWCRDIERIIHA